MSKFFKDNKIARARSASAVCSLWKFVLVLHEKNALVFSQSDARNFLMYI